MFASGNLACTSLGWLQGLPPILRYVISHVLPYQVMCASLLWLQLRFIVVLYTAGHGKECVTEVVRVESADSPLSAMAGVKAPPQGTSVCEITF